MTLNRVMVMDVRIDLANRSPVVILRDEERNDLFLPIWVGDMEAASIQMALERRSLERPLTHDLLVNVMGRLGANPRMLLINRIEEQTYYAELVIERDGRRVDIDCRPSDGIAIALRLGIPIYVENELLYPIRISESDIEHKSPMPEIPVDHEIFKEFLKELQPKDFALGSADDMQKGE